MRPQVGFAAVAVHFRVILFRSLWSWTLNITFPLYAVWLDCIEAVMPCGADDWTRAYDKFVDIQINRDPPPKWPERDLGQMKRKFQDLALAKPPTGQTDCPPEVTRARHLYHRIDNYAGKIVHEVVQESSATIGQTEGPVAGAVKCQRVLFLIVWAVCLKHYLRLSHRATLCTEFRDRSSGRPCSRRP